MAAAAGTTGVDISSVFDPVYWGVMISTSLVGITIVQAWTYMNNNRDGWIFRSFVAVIVLATFACTALDFQFLRHYLILNFGNLENLALQTKPLLAQYILLETLVFISQIFFATRVYILAKRDYFTPILICLLGAVGYYFGLAAVVDVIQADYISIRTVESQQYKIHSVGARLGVLLGDLTFTIALSWRLSRSQSTIKQTNTVLERLLIAIVSRGIILTVAVLVSAILVIQNSESITWMILDYSYSKIYVSTMLFMLNMRPELRGEMHSGNLGRTESRRAIVVRGNAVPDSDIAVSSGALALSDRASNDKSRYTGKGAEVLWV